MSENLAFQKVLEKVKRQKEKEAEELLKIEREISENFRNALIKSLKSDLNTIIAEERQLLRQNTTEIKRNISYTMKLKKELEKVSTKKLIKTSIITLSATLGVLIGSAGLTVVVKEQIEEYLRLREKLEPWKKYATIQAGKDYIVFDRQPKIYKTKDGKYYIDLREKGE